MRRTEQLPRKLNNVVYILFASLCLCMLLSTALYVVAHGVKSSGWELYYLYDFLIAAALVFGFRAINRKRANTGAEETCTPKLSPKAAAGVLCLFSFAVQLIVISILKVEPRSDYGKFFYTAQAIAAGENIFNSTYLALFPHIMGYSNFLAVLFRILGRNDFVPLLNAFLNTCSTLLIFIITLRFSGHREAFQAGLIWSICPSMLIYNTMVLSEPLYTCLILLFILLMINAEQCTAEKSWGLLRYALIGLAMGLLLRGINIIRPVAGILIIALLLWIVFLGGIQLFQRKWGACAIFLFMLAGSYWLTGAWWTDHITEQLGEAPASFPIYNIYTGFNQEVSGTHSGEDEELLQAQRNLTGATADSAQRGLLEPLKERLRSIGLHYPKLLAEKMKNFAGNDESPPNYLFDELSIPQILLLRNICNIPYYAIILMAVINTVRNRNRFPKSVFVLMPLYVLGLTLAHVLFLEVEGRYHYSMVPMLIILSQEPKTDAL